MGKDGSQIGNSWLAMVDDGDSTQQHVTSTDLQHKHDPAMIDDQGMCAKRF